MCNDVNECKAAALANCDGITEKIDRLNRRRLCDFRPPPLTHPGQPVSGLPAYMLGGWTAGPSHGPPNRPDRWAARGTGRWLGAPPRVVGARGRVAARAGAGGPPGALGRHLSDLPGWGGNLQISPGPRHVSPRPGQAGRSTLERSGGRYLPIEHYCSAGMKKTVYKLAVT